MGLFLKSVFGVVLHLETSLGASLTQKKARHFDLEAHRSKDVYILFFCKQKVKRMIIHGWYGFSAYRRLSACNKGTYEKGGTLSPLIKAE